MKILLKTLPSKVQTHSPIHHQISPHSFSDLACAAAAVPLPLCTRPASLATRPQSLTPFCSPSLTPSRSSSLAPAEPRLAPLPVLGSQSVFRKNSRTLLQASVFERNEQQLFLQSGGKRSDSHKAAVT
ncbi:putative leucine-rich repeat and fibronectin type-III domain-containing [Sesbania bispinosa]|nr:putative leucine-rich repeat and fibronectin type-III domain-containing [Sesbania bispinosa]